MGSFSEGGFSFVAEPIVYLKGLDGVGLSERDLDILVFCPVVVEDGP